MARRVMTNFTGNSAGPSRPGRRLQAANEVPGGTIAEVLDWVGDDAERAQRAYDAEMERGADEQRKGVYEELENKFPLGTVDDVINWVGDDPEYAQTALDFENAKAEPRKSLVEKLERLTASDDDASVGSDEDE